jgi:DNA-binding PadR family transcriptional regulator
MADHTGQAGLLPGTLDLLTLKAVSLGKLLRCAVLLRIEHISGGALHIQQGVRYAARHRLEHHGVLESECGTSENNRRAKYSRLSAAGRCRLGEETANWNRLLEATACSLAAIAMPREI